MSGPGITWSAVEDVVHDWVTTATGLANDHVFHVHQNEGRPTSPFITFGFGNVRRIGIDAVTYTNRPLVLANIVATPDVPSSTFAAPAHGLNTGDGPIQIQADGYGLTSGVNYWVIAVDADHFQVASTFQNAKASTILVLAAGVGSLTFVSTASTVRAGQELTATSTGARQVKLTFQAFAAVSDGAQGAVSLLDSVVTALPLYASTLRASGVCVLDTGPVQSTGGVIDSTVFEPRAILEVTLYLASILETTDTIIERVKAQGTVDTVQEPEVTIDSGS